MRCWHGPQVAAKDVPRLFTPFSQIAVLCLLNGDLRKADSTGSTYMISTPRKGNPWPPWWLLPGCAYRHSICQPIMGPPTFRDWVGPSWIPMGFWVWTVWLGSWGPGSVLQRRCIGQKLLWQVWRWINPLKFPSAFRVVAAGVRSCPNMFGPVVYALFCWAKLGFTHPWVALGLGTVF